MSASAGRVTIDWDLAVEGVPTDRLFENLDLDKPGDLDEAIERHRGAPMTSPEG